MSGEILRTDALAIGYTAPRKADVIVAAALELSLAGGELVCLIGPNGAGKTTLMRTLAGMLPPLGGRVLIGGADVHSLPPQERARRLSIVLTERIQVGMLNAYSLVALGRYPYTNWSGALTPDDEAVVRWAIEAVGAVPLADRQVGELSDGERQKVMIARALAQQPDLMLLDEPTAFLDLPRRVEIMRLLREIAHTTGRAILLSTHDLDLALRTADRIWLMPGQQAQDSTLISGAPEDLVLNGAFAAAFRSEGVVFDPATGAFRVQAEPAGRVALTGEGLPVVWTRRALERAGLTVCENCDDPPLRVIVLSHDNHTLWRVTTADGHSHDYDSLYAVVAAVRQFPQ